MAAPQHQTTKARKKGPKLTKDGKITVFDAEDSTYGIRELIDLIRYIPEGQDVFFGAEMIKKTLNSMQISIHDIMQDGVEKRKLAAKTIQHLVAEISDYQRRIQSLKGHIRHLRFELGEVQDTCHYLLSDDVELSQYQHILEEVPKSPIEGPEHEDDIEEKMVLKDADPSVTDDNQQKTESEAQILKPVIPEDAAQEHFQQSETLIAEDQSSDDFLPDALKNPDEDYKNSDESHIPTLTDEVFNPDRFDDENGVAKQKANNASDPTPALDSSFNAIDMELSGDPTFEEEITPTNEDALTKSQAEMDRELDSQFDELDEAASDDEDDDNDHDSLANRL